MDKPLSKFLLLLLVVGVILGTILGVRNRGTKSSYAPSNLPELLAAPEATNPPSNGIDVGSPDGQKTLTMSTAKSGPQVTYTFAISDENGNKNTVFTKTLDSGSFLSIPGNTFSPDDRYFFLKETDPNQVDFIVVAANGSPMSPGMQTFEVASQFAQKESNYKLADVTGWAAPTLLIVNSTKNDNGALQSFWFDIGSQSFISLATYFH